MLTVRGSNIWNNILRLIRECLVCATLKTHLKSWFKTKNKTQQPTCCSTCLGIHMYTHVVPVSTARHCLFIHVCTSLVCKCCFMWNLPWGYGWQLAVLLLYFTCVQEDALSLFNKLINEYVKINTRGRHFFLRGQVDTHLHILATVRVRQDTFFWGRFNVIQYDTITFNSMRYDSSPNASIHFQYKSE